MNPVVERAVAAFLGETEIDWEKLKPIMCFVVLWNRLEVRHNRQLNATRLAESIRNVAAHPAFSFDKYLLAFQYFQTRYTANRKRLLSLLGPSTRHPELPFRECLLGLLNNDEQSSEDRLKGLMYIPYRIRNNLFHGNKTTAELYDQTELFQNVNEVLLHFESEEYCRRNTR